MSVFKNWTRKAVESVKEVMTKDTADKLDIYGSLAKIGIFVLLMIGMLKKNDHHHSNNPDFSQITVNNYYYGKERK